MASSSTMSSTFDGGRRQLATTIWCQLCNTYGHQHCSHFAYLTQVDATWQYATLRDPDIQRIMDKFLPEDHRPHVLPPGDALVQACFKCCGLKVHNDEHYYVKEKDGVEMPSAPFKKLVLKTMKSAAGDQQVTNLLERLERKCGSVIAEVVRVELDTLRNERVSKAADWVSQLSSTEVFCKSLDCQFLYSCLLCGLLLARNASWYLLERPNTKPFWVCARCGHEWAGKNRGRILVVKVSGENEAVLCKIPEKFQRNSMDSSVSLKTKSACCA